jgi:hypothetical protein
MAQIEITSRGSPLIQITFGGGELTLQSNLGDRSSAQAIGVAMERFGRSLGAGASEQARAEVASLRGRGAGARVLAEAMARMYSEVMGSLGLPEFAIDLEDWAPTDAN